MKTDEAFDPVTVGLFGFAGQPIELDSPQLHGEKRNNSTTVENFVIFGWTTYNLMKNME